MHQSSACEQRLRELIGTDLPANELRRLAHADAQLRLTAAHDRDQAAKTSSEAGPSDFIRPPITEIES